MLKTAGQYRQDEENAKKLSQTSIGFSFGKATVGSTDKSFATVATAVTTSAVNTNGSINGKGINTYKGPTLALPLSIAPLRANLTVSSVYSKEVEKLQKRLQELGYTVDVDGYFGKQTLSAVNAFKNKYGLGNTGKYQGVVGEQTWLFLFGKLSGELSNESKDYSSHVRMAQIRLKELGYGVEVNGYFNDETLKAVNEFKTKNKLGNSGDWAGKIGPQTWEVLFGSGAIVNINKKDENTYVKPQTNQLLSKQSIEMIMKFEVTSKSLYVQKYQHPVLPGESSGITIGIGYDLGQVSLEQFRKDWADKLSVSDFELLSQCIGKHLIVGNDANNKSMKALLSKVSKVTISWDQAESVYINRTLPKYIDLARHTFPNFDKLPENAQGALVSLVINRGGDLDKDNPRRKEMVQIADFMKNKKSFTQSDLDFISSKIIGMKRLWPNSAGLRDRRDFEAAYLKNALKSNDNSTISTPSYKPPDNSNNKLNGHNSTIKIVPVNQINLNKKGCAVASFVMIANFFGANTDFKTVESKFVSKGYMLDFSKAAKAYGLTYSDKRGITEAEVLALARKSLDKGEPVLIQIYGNGVTHFVVAVGYKGDGKNAKDFTIVDPWGGVEKTLDKASRYDKGPVTSIRFITKEANK